MTTSPTTPTTPTLTPSHELDFKIFRLLGLTAATVPAYSTDMNAAVELLKEIRGWAEIIYGNGRWIVEYPPFISETADTPAMAICKAFLASKGVTE